MTGIDISGVQPNDVPGNWEFIVVKSSEGNSVVNPRVGAQWIIASRTTRGLYHYARPALGSGSAQATVFCDDALRRGFKPGVDLWQLDAETGENAGVSAAQWRQFITDFMAVALTRLGERGFLYIGWPVVVQFGVQDLIYRYMWWYPGYGRNDGTDHGIPAGVPSGLVVIHQFTSFPSLDQNHVLNAAAYNRTAPTTKVRAMNTPPLAMKPWAAEWRRPDGSVIAAVSDDGDVYAFGCRYRKWSNQHVDFAGRHSAAIGPSISHDPNTEYTITATSGEHYTPNNT